MTEAFITEYAGSRGGPVARYYEYDRDGVRVFDNKKVLRRLYYFDPSSDMMTECDPLKRDRILRRFLFDRLGMLEETFSFGHPPRTFRYENGGRQIAVREGGQYGAVGKLFTFESKGITETEWGRNGEINRVYIFEPAGDAIFERAGGWFGSIDRTLVFDGMNAAVFREPEAFLQFLVFTELPPGERGSPAQTDPDEGRNRQGPAASGSRYAFRGKRSTGPEMRTREEEETQIDLIPDADRNEEEDEEPEKPWEKRSSEIPYAERKKGRNF